MAAHGNDKAKDGHQTEHRCMGLVREAHERAEKRKNRPQPWIMRKFAVFITIGIIVYTWYVYIGTFCVPMIRHDPNALASRGMGISFLVVFSVLGLMMIWAYEKILLTPPGYAKDYVRKSSPPVIRNALPTWWDTESEADLAAARYAASQNPQPQRERKHKRTESKHQRTVSGSAAVLEAESKESGSAKSPQNPPQIVHVGEVPSTENGSVGSANTLPPIAAAHAKAIVGAVPPARPEQAHMEPEPLPGTANAQTPMMFTRSPPKTPVFLPEYRYCHKDGFQKPFRAHHCRACGTCILKYDHHCPWVGQCVGAQNHRFFLIFVFWALFFCSFVFSTLVGLNARGTARHGSTFVVDGQHVAILVMSGFFVIFTFALLVTHAILIATNMSTVEQMGMKRMEAREKRVLGRLHPWWASKARSATKALWDREWGRIGKEGHMWWLGSARKNWEAVMGDQVYMWFLPIGHSPDDGISYIVNPRFDEEGRWRPRSEWPKELQ